jgi:phosphonopyruvate decarboxylase
MGLNARTLLRALLDSDVRFFAGVPDSVLAHLCFAIGECVPRDAHVISANEGGAIAAATGHYLATGGTPAVYLQNSGLGNAFNPLASLASPTVVGVPMLLLVGWRGEPGTDDEVEHHLQGRVTTPMLELVGVSTAVLPDDEAAAIACIRALLDRARQTRTPAAALIRPGRISASPQQSRTAAAADDGDATMTRERAIATIVEHLPADAVVVATTGKASRELWEIRERAAQHHDRDFLMVGSMGHASQIALGLALSRPSVPVVCLDGDAAMVMHMGSLAVIGASGAANLDHIVLHNGAHDSVGGHQSAAAGRSFPAIALACGYAWSRAAGDEETLRSALQEMSDQAGPSLLEVRVRRGARADLGRPRWQPNENALALRAQLARDRDRR